VTAIFVAHGAPSLALEEDAFTRAAQTFGATLDGAKAIVIVSAHWQARGVMRANAVPRPEPIYDFGGFSPELYTLRYDAPGDPALAAEVAAIIGGTLETERGWDHGVWVPLRHLRPAADIPIVELSLPYGADPRALFEAGRRLAPLRDRGVVICGSGGIVHNLRLIDLSSKEAPVAPWAKEFDDWIATRIAARDFDSIIAYRTLAPHAERAVPTPEHFEPLLIALGALREEERAVAWHEGFQYGSLSMRSIRSSSN
jgi:4,5-DOPA dioxygenase extradiol